MLSQLTQTKPFPILQVSYYTHSYLSFYCICHMMCVNKQKSKMTISYAHSVNNYSTFINHTTFQLAALFCNLETSIIITMIIIMKICKGPTLWLKALNKHNLRQYFCFFHFQILIFNKHKKIKWKTAVCVFVYSIPFNKAMTFLQFSSPLTIYINYKDLNSKKIAKFKLLPNGKALFVWIKKNAF